MNSVSSAGHLSRTTDHLNKEEYTGAIVDSICSVFVVADIPAIILRHYPRASLNSLNTSLNRDQNQSRDSREKPGNHYEGLS